MAAIAAKTRGTYIARHKAGHSPDGGGLAHPDAYTSPMTPFGIYPGEYIIRYSIGSDPPMETYGIPDTGSGLIWLQCLPCNDKICTGNPNAHCEPPDGYCHYNLTYLDQSMTSGNLATETLTFADDTGPTQIAKLYNMVIGCGHYNIDHREDKGAIGPPGVVGLGWKSSSLIGQLGFNRFSYCASPNGDLNKGHSLLKIGSSGALITGKETQTPLYSFQSGLYFVNVTDLMVDGERLNIPPDLFTKSIAFDGSGIVRSSQPTRTARSVFWRSLPWSPRGGTTSCRHSPPSQTDCSTLLPHARNYVNIRRHRKRLCIEH
ncbi:hypothetical protein CRG98_029254 [Punica granatum]|uniref:Peptidase A1 domain-containing protein n=1 Tax=Punica granatum TaxID=22663 RepID=A0A2I0J2A7_PUNGR|nr:hypothetical protein CRG98_029254 [Punica granatum]